MRFKRGVTVKVKAKVRVKVRDEVRVKVKVHEDINFDNETVYRLQR